MNLEAPNTAPTTDTHAAAPDDTATERHRSYNPNRRPRSADARDLIATVIRTADEATFRLGLRQRVHRRDARVTYEQTIEAIISDVAYRYLTEDHPRVAISLSKTVLNDKSRYRPATYGQQVLPIVNLLGDPRVGILQVERGERGRPIPFAKNRTGLKRTTIAAGPALVDLLDEACLDPSDFGKGGGLREVIELRDRGEDFWDQSTPVEYTDTPDTIRYRAEVTAINEWLANADLAFHDPDPWRDPEVDTSDRSLRRIFARGRFDRGGRLYGGFWQGLKSEDRLKGLRIDGEKVASLDFGQMNPRLLYAKVQSTAPEADVYRVPRLEGYRETVKAVLNASIAADKRFEKFPKDSRKGLPKTWKVAEVIEAIEEAHPAIAYRLFQGEGLGLQFTESEILVKVLLRLRDQGITALPVHDAIVVARSNAEKAKVAMEEVFGQTANMAGIVKVERVG